MNHSNKCMSIPECVYNLKSCAIAKNPINPVNLQGESAKAPPKTIIEFVTGFRV